MGWTNGRRIFWRTFKRRRWGFVGRFWGRWWFWRRGIKRFVVMCYNNKINVRYTNPVSEQPGEMKDVKPVLRRVFFWVVILITVSNSLHAQKPVPELWGVQVHDLAEPKVLSQ